MPLITDSAIPQYTSSQDGDLLVVQRGNVTGKIPIATMLGQTDSVVDDFDRDDTAAGLGTAPTGQAWTLFGPGWGASTANITSGRYVSPQNVTSYAWTAFFKKNIRLGGKFSFTAGGGTDAATVTIIADAATTYSTTLSNMVHFGVSTTQWFLQLRTASGTFDTIASGSLSLAADGTIYEAYMTINGNEVYLELPDGTTYAVTNTRITSDNSPQGLYGQSLIWEISSTATSRLPRWESIECKPIDAIGATANAMGLAGTQFQTVNGSPGHQDFINAYPKIKGGSSNGDNAHAPIISRWLKSSGDSATANLTVTITATLAATAAGWRGGCLRVYATHQNNYDWGANGGARESTYYFVFFNGQVVSRIAQVSTNTSNGPTIAVASATNMTMTISATYNDTSVPSNSPTHEICLYVELLTPVDVTFS